MKLSKQEQLILSILGVLILGIVYYQFMLKPHLAKNEELKQTQSELAQEYAEYEATIATIVTQESQQQILGLNVDARAKGYYEALVQEQIILDLNQLLVSHQLSGKIDFSQALVEGVSVMSRAENLKVASSLQQQIDIYQGERDTITPPTVEETPVETPETPAETPSVGATTVEQMKISLAVEGNYATVQKFIKAVETYQKRMIITNVEMKALAEGNVSAAMQLELYAIPSLSEITTVWGLTGTYGKDVPFSNLGSAFSQTLLTADENKRDFVGIVKSSYSDLASFMLGKADDSEKTSYLVDDRNATIEASMKFGQVDGSYTYAYSVGEQSYPTSGTTTFSPRSNYIIVDLVSEALVDSRDVSKLDLTIENTTDKTVVIFVRSDDETAPRIRVNGVSESVVVVKQ